MKNTYKRARVLTPHSTYPITPEEPHRHSWQFYDGALGYESSRCELCGLDFNDVKEKLTLQDVDRLAAFPALLEVAAKLLAVAETIPTPATHDGLTLISILANSRALITDWQTNNKKEKT